jgi:CRP-like cAMP-binding protein
MWLTVLANFAYVLMLIAFVTRDVLYLRSLLAFAQTVVVFYTWHNGVPIISAWNALYMAINVYMVVQILRERRAVVLPAELQVLHERHFAALTPAEFQRWWRQGRRETLDHGALARAGEKPESLTFLLSGAVRVHRDGERIAELPAGFFVGEMSLLTDRPATADVDVAVRSEVMRWPRVGLDAIRQRNPALWTKIQSVIGLDLVAKIRRGEASALQP